MPGVIAVVGIRDATSVVRRAARPLLRRPTHQLALESDATDAVAVGFAGEHGGVASDPASGVLLAVDGEITLDDSSVTGAQAATILLRRYLDGMDDVPQGWFSAAVWDPRRGELDLVADAFGHRPLYSVRAQGGILAASELKALLAAGVRPELDDEAWAELFAYEFVLGRATPLAGVRGLSPGSTVSLSPDQDERVRERWRYRLEPRARAAREELVPRFHRLLDQAVARRLDGSTALALSGGLDSRCLAAVLAARAPATPTVSYGAAGSEDLTIGARVAQATGLPHLPYALEAGYLARGAAETVWLTEGQVRCFHSHHLVLRSLRAAGAARALLIGFGGDPIVRAPRVPDVDGDERALVAALHAQKAACIGDRLAEELFAPPFLARIRGRAQAALARHLEDEEGEPAARMRQFVLRQSHRRKVLPGAELFLDDVVPRDPFDDRDLVEFCRRLPTEWRLGGRLERAFLQGFPELAALSNPKEGIPPSLEGRRRRRALYGALTRRRAHSLFDRTLGPGRRHDRRGIGDYATDLRQASGEALQLLLEPRTAARGQIRVEAVRRLIRATQAGRARHARALGMLLTFELFQRQFLDGEGPPP